MSSLLRHWRVLVVAVCCAVAGAGASAIATAGAATTHATTTKSAKAHVLKGRRALLRRMVHGSFVVYTKDGFKTITLDRGTVDSVSGQQIKLTEGTKKATYQTVTITIPSTAKVRDNGQVSSLSAVQAGQRVLIFQGPKQTVVAAHTPKTAG